MKIRLGLLDLEREFQADDLNRGAGFENGDAGAGVAQLGDLDRLGGADDPDPRARG